jgi:hypothetical protein
MNQTPAIQTDHLTRDFGSVRALAWIGLVLVYFVLVVLTIMALGFLGVPVQAWLEAGNLTPLVLGAAGVLALLDGALLALALHRFQRARLLGV